MDVYNPATELVHLPPLPKHRVFRPRTLFSRRHRRGLNLLFAFLGGLVLGLWTFSLSPTCATLSLARESRAARPSPHNETNRGPVPLEGEGRGLLFVGVMTARKYLGTRAVAVYETWGRELPGRLAFFSSESSTPPSSKPDLPLVSLRGVDDSYPPQKKSFLMLQHMWEEYGSRFEWFMRADDDVYVRGDKIGAFLRSVDSSKPLFIGQAGRGNQEEFGLLSLEYDENFCMGGPGVILSRETLSRVAPHIKHCLKNLYTTHEDVELGRCVQKFAGIPCTWSYEMQTIFYHNSSGSKAFTGNLKQKEVHRAITLHPVKQYQHMYRIHNYMKMLKIQELQQKSIHLNRDIYSMGRLIEEHSLRVNSFLPDAYKPVYRDSAIIGQPPSLKKFNTSSQKELILWSFIQRSLYSADSINPRKRIDASLREGLDDVIREVMDLINMFSKQRGRVIDFKEILYGYQRHNPLYGAEYILDLLLVYRKYRGRKMTVPVRRHAYFQQQFTGMSMRELVEGEEFNSGTEDVGLGWANLPSLLLLPSTENAGSSSTTISTKLVHFILPLSGRFQTFKRFIKNFEEVCLRPSEKVALTVVLFQGSLENSFHQTEELISALQANYKDYRISLIPVYDKFARAQALQLGAGHANSPDELLFFIDVDIVFRNGVLQRVRANTVKGKWVYFPIVFSEFDPKFVYALNSSPHHFTFNNAAGYWRQYGFGIGSVYKTDLDKVGGFDVGIKGWGKEDVDLFEKFINATPPLKILRAPDPDLVHVFHPAECDPGLEEPQLKMCLATRSDTYGNTPQLASFIVKDKKLSRLLGLAVT